MKSDLNAIYNATDLVSGGLLSTIKSSILNTYQGYFEDKFNDLMKNLLNNDITENEVLEYIKHLGKSDKDIFFAIVQKNIQSETKIKKFLLSKILFFKIKNTILDYFHSNLLTNIDLFSEKDFENFYTICNKHHFSHSNSTTKGLELFSGDFQSQDYKVTISKLKSIGIIALTDDYSFQNWRWDEEDWSFYIDKTGLFDQLSIYVSEYYNKVYPSE